MIISDTKQFIFVHVEKTGGTSMVHALEEHRIPRVISQASSILRLVGLPKCYHRYKYGRHAPLKDAELRMPETAFKSYFKFAFVRNPYDRLVSEYNAAIKKATRARHRRIAGFKTFEDFVRYEIKRGKFHQLPMLKLMGGQVGLDFVGRFENLEADFAHVSGQLDISVTLEKRNAYSHKKYQTYYSSSVRTLVETHWAEELEYFNYSFD